jgi:phenylacetate-CoA ligase
MPSYQPQPAALEPIETASTDQLRALQQVRLRDTLRRAYAGVAHYRTAFDTASVHPEDITSLDQLALLPFTTKDDKCRNYPFGMFAVPATRLPASTPRPVPPVNPPLSATPVRTCRPGLRSWP